MTANELRRLSSKELDTLRMLYNPPYLSENAEEYFARKQAERTRNGNRALMWGALFALIEIGLVAYWLLR